MMKRIKVACILILLVKLGFAQTMDKADFKKISGRYGQTTEGICLFEDGRFLLYGYATAVFGKYTFEKDHLSFLPDRAPLFAVYGVANNSIGDSTRINFRGFDRGSDSFVQFGDKELRRVFNEDANCFASPFVYKTIKLKGKITLSSAVDDEASAMQKPGSESWVYELPAAYNDFIFICNAPSRYEEKFEAIVETTKDGDVLRTSNYARERGFAKNTVDTDDKNWKELLDFKKEYDGSKTVADDVIYANQHYNAFPEPKEDYVFNNDKNQFKSKSADENKLRFVNDQYNDDRYLRKYTKINPGSKTKFNRSLAKISPLSIFYTVCNEGTTESYKYDGYIKIDEANTSSGEGAPILQTIPNVPMQMPIEAPLADGFYLLKATDGPIPKFPSFTPSDVKTVSKNADNKGFTIAFTTAGIQKLKNGLAGSRILVVTNGKKLATQASFKIIGQSVQLLGDFTATEIQEISNQFKK